MSKTIGVIGVGSIGRRHAKNLLALGHHVLMHDPRFEEDSIPLDELFDSSDAVVIASPTFIHEHHIYECEAHDKPYFVEKPIKSAMSDTLGQNAVMVGYNLRFHSCVKQARKWMPQIGRPLWANFTVAQFSDKPDYLRDGVILNWSHEIDLALYLLGPAKIIHAATRLKMVNGGLHDDIADLLLVHTWGCQSTVHLDYVTKPEVRQSIIVGEEATIIMDLVNRQTWLRGADGTIWDFLEGQDSWDENYMEEMAAFIDRLDGKETIGCTGQEGLEVLKLCLEAKRLSR